jgi:hypothetical protein
VLRSPGAAVAISRRRPSTERLTLSSGSILRDGKRLSLGCSIAVSHSGHGAGGEWSRQANPAANQKTIYPPAPLVSTPGAILLVVLVTPGAWRKARCKPPLRVRYVRVGGNRWA